jgi:ligand-binding sensor domain-containing protein
MDTFGLRPRTALSVHGFKFVTFGTDREPAINEFGVSSILVAKDGTLWVGSVGGGLTHMAAGSMVHFGIEQGLAALTLRALYQSSDSTIWAGNKVPSIKAGRFYSFASHWLLFSVGSCSG